MLSKNQTYGGKNMNKQYLIISAAIIAMLPVLATAERTLTRIATMPDGAEVTGISKTHSKTMLPQPSLVTLRGSTHQHPLW
jgi:hypothetical protein